MSKELITLKGVSKVYRRHQFDVVALQNCDLQILEGEHVALMGPSGSGKTTLLNLIAGFDAPTTGAVIVDGVNISELSEGDVARWRVRGLGFIFQFYNLIPVLTAAENVELPLLLLKMSRAERRRRVLTALKVVGLEDRADHYPRQLSGGQEQRVSIARAVVTDPKLLLGDEPTGNLDAQSADEVLTLLEQLNKRFGKTIVMVTHDARAARRAQRIIRLEKGAIVSEPAGTPV
jgi:putative ABC transport system ATP-binding protein